MVNNNICLVVEPYPSEKWWSESQWEGLYIPCMKWKINHQVWNHQSFNSDPRDKLRVTLFTDFFLHGHELPFSLENHGPMDIQFSDYPLVNKQFAIEHDPFSSLIYPLNMVIFHSYVKLPEGNIVCVCHPISRCCPIDGWIICHDDPHSTSFHCHHWTEINIGEKQRPTKITKNGDLHP